MKEIKENGPVQGKEKLDLKLITKLDMHKSKLLPQTILENISCLCINCFRITKITLILPKIQYILLYGSASICLVYTLELDDLLQS